MVILYLCSMKLLKYLIIYRTTKNPMMAAQIYQMIYHPEIKQPTSSLVGQPSFQYVEKPVIDTPKVISKKDELLSSLAYLKSKKNPTKQEKDSIYTIEMVLKNMK